MRVRIFLPILLAILAGCDFKVAPNPKQTADQKPQPAAKPAALPHSEAEKAEVVETARSITGLMERGEYGKAWDGAGEAMKRMTPRSAFVTFMTASRSPLGQLGSRDTYRISFTRQIDPALPEGDYAMVEFDSAVEKKTVTERVVLGRVTGEWKLLGYFFDFKIKVFG